MVNVKINFLLYSFSKQWSVAEDYLLFPFCERELFTIFRICNPAYGVVFSILVQFLVVNFNICLSIPGRRPFFLLIHQRLQNGDNNIPCQIIQSLNSHNFRPQSIQPHINFFIASINLFYIMYGASALGTKGCDNQTHPSSDVGRGHGNTT